MSSSEPINLVLEHLRHIRSTVDRIAEVQREHGDRLTALDLGLASLRREQAGDAEAAARINARVDRTNDRITRIERRLDLLDEPT